MPAITVRNISEPVHASLRHLAAARHVSVEALIRDALGALVTQSRPGGIDFTKLAKDRAALGLGDDGPAWTEALDDAAFSRGVLGLDGS